MIKRCINKVIVYYGTVIVLASNYTEIQHSWSETWTWFKSVQKFFSHETQICLLIWGHRWIAGKNNETKRKIRIIDEESSNHEGEDTTDSDGVEELIKPDTDNMRTVQDLSSCTSSAKVFSTLDSRNGFWQIKGDWVLTYFTLQHPITTFSSPFGRCKFLQMPFGITSGYDFFQRTME